MLQTYWKRWLSPSTIRVLRRSARLMAGPPCALFYEFQPQLVVLDLVMPMMSGVEVCRQVRAMSDVPVVFLGGVEDTDQKIEALKAGGDDFIVKGGSFNELLGPRLKRTSEGRSQTPPPRLTTGSRTGSSVSIW